MTTVHKGSLLAQARAAEATLRERRDEIGKLLEMRQGQVADVAGQLHAVPLDIRDLDKVVKLQGRRGVLIELTKRTKARARVLGQELGQATARLSNLESRLGRLEESIGALQDPNQDLPYSPSKREHKLLKERFKHNLLAGDGQLADKLRGELLGSAQGIEASKLQMELDAYRRDLENLVGQITAVV